MITETLSVASRTSVVEGVMRTRTVFAILGKAVVIRQPCGLEIKDGNLQIPEDSLLLGAGARG